MHRRTRIVALGLTLILALVGWQFRHEIMGVARTLSLPNVEAPPAGTVRFAVIGDYGSGRSQESDLARKNREE